VIQDNDLPLYPIGDVTTVDAATGVVDSLDVVCRLRGIVHGVNLRASTNGLQFVVKDSTGTIWTFQGIKNFGYTVTEGDAIEMRGAIKQFNGVTQIALDTVILLNSGLPLMNTIPVTSFLEANEADLVGLNMFKLVDPAQWTGMGASGFNVRITNNVDTFTVRIDNDVDLYALPAPACEWFNIRGLLGQFDSSNPYTAGYQLFPRYVQDINCIPAPAMSFTMMTSSVLENIPTTNVTVAITNPNPDPTIATIALSGTATNTSDYTLASTTVTFPPNSTTNVTIPVNIVNDALTEGDETIVLTLTNPTNGAQIGTAAHTITIVDDDGISITPALHQSTITLFPNPGTESFTVKSSEHVNTVIVFDINGKECFRTSHTLSPISMGHLARGMYLIQAITDKGNWNGKWIKE
jgi:hypothetical protein